MDGTGFGRYTLLDVIGEGGMGLVYRAHDSATDRVVALKVLADHIAADETYRERFRREARITAGLREPHVVPIHDFGEIDGHLYLDMRLIDGADVKTLLSEGPLPPERAVAIVEQVAAALDAAHADGLLHRDVKPSNVLVSAGDFVYLIDFGIARGVAEAKITTTGATVGTFAYMAPERFSLTAPDARCDIYALACVLHEMLTGKTPYPGDSVEQQVAGHLSGLPPRPSIERAGVPAGFDDVIAIGMARNPGDRYASAGELAQAARAALTGTVPHRRPTRTADGRSATTVVSSDRRRASRWRRRKPILLAGAGVVIAIVVGAATVWLIRDRSDAPTPITLTDAPTLEASGFGEKDGNIWVGAIVRDTQPGSFVTASFNLLDAGGSILATATPMKQALYADERMIIDAVLRRPDGPAVVKVEATLQARTYDSPLTAPKFTDVVLEVGDVTVSDADGITTAKATITNPSDQQLPGVNVGVACFDAAGTIIGGGPAVYLGAVPAKKQVLATAYITAASVPDRCEMTAQPSQY